MNKNEATEKLKRLVTRCKECKFATCENCEINWNEVQAIETILNELNSKKGTINALQEALKERTNERDKKDEKINKKDKIIDAMALQLFGVLIWDDKKEELITLNTAEEVKQYFERRAEDE